MVDAVRRENTMEMKVNGVLLYITMILYSEVGVFFDLYTTKMALSMGFIELIPLGNRPEIYYPYIFVYTSIIFILGYYFSILFRNSKFLILTITLITLTNAIPYVAGLHNLRMMLLWK
jgi:hypothetical protein